MRRRPRKRRRRRRRRRRKTRRRRRRGARPGQCCVYMFMVQSGYVSGHKLVFEAKRPRTRHRPWLAVWVHLFKAVGREEKHARRVVWQTLSRKTGCAAVHHKQKCGSNPVLPSRPPRARHRSSAFHRSLLFLGLCDACARLASEFPCSCAHTRRPARSHMHARTRGAA